MAFILPSFSAKGSISLRVVSNMFLVRPGPDVPYGTFEKC